MKRYIVTFTNGYTEIQGNNIADAINKLSNSLINDIIQITLKR